MKEATSYLRITVLPALVISVLKIMRFYVINQFVEMEIAKHMIVTGVITSLSLTV